MYCTGLPVTRAACRLRVNTDPGLASPPCRRCGPFPATAVSGIRWFFQVRCSGRNLTSSAALHGFSHPPPQQHRLPAGPLDAGRKRRSWPIERRGPSRSCCSARGAPTSAALTRPRLALRLAHARPLLGSFVAGRRMHLCPGVHSNVFNVARARGSSAASTLHAVPRGSWRDGIGRGIDGRLAWVRWRCSDHCGGSMFASRPPSCARLACGGRPRRWRDDRVGSRCRCPDGIPPACARRRFPGRYLVAPPSSLQMRAAPWGAPARYRPSWPVAAVVLRALALDGMTRQPGGETTPVRSSGPLPPPRPGCVAHSGSARMRRLLSQQAPVRR